MDASAAREQRKLRADCESLEDRLRKVEEESLYFNKLHECESERNSEANEEAKSIMRAVRRERVQHEAVVQSLQLELQRSEDREAKGMERVREAEDHGVQEALALEKELRESKARSEMLEDGRRSMVRELTAARNEVVQADLAAAERDRQG